MKPISKPRLKTIATVVVACLCSILIHDHLFAQSVPINESILNSIVTILVEDNTGAREVGSGVIVRADGLVLTAYHLVAGARGIQVRLHNGETFDRVELIATDERRNLAILRTSAAFSYPIPGATIEEAMVGTRVFIVPNAKRELGSEGILTSVSLADEIPGAGSGYRVLKFTAAVPPDSIGGMLVDDKGRALGVLVARPQAASQTYAVPLSGVFSLIHSVGIQRTAASTLATPSSTPAPIPQNSVLVPQRPVLPLEAKGPGSVVVKPSRPVDVLLASKTIYVASETDFFQPQHLINALKKRAEIDHWGLVFVDDPRVADILLTLDHVPLTWKFTFSLAHQRTGVIVATGSVIIWDGNLGAGKMADRVIEKLTQARAQK